jgi:citrate lyase beta subunit
MSKQVLSFYTERALEPIVSIDLPLDVSSELRQATKHGAKEAISQMLAHLGVRSEITYIFGIDAMATEEIDEELDRAHALEISGVVLPGTNEVLGRPTL